MIFFPLSLSSMCRDAFCLNVIVREKRMKRQSVDGFYRLKNELIRYLYQHGHAVEVLEHIQERECWTCGGNGCPRCNDTGIYAKTKLYAFTFKVGGRRYKWHQVARLVNYPVTVTDPVPAMYNEPVSRGDVEMNERQEFWAVFRLWFGLLVRGCDVPKKIRIIAILPIWAQTIVRRIAAWLECIEWPVRICKECRRPYIVGRFSPMSFYKHNGFCSQKCDDEFCPF